MTRALGMRDSFAPKNSLILGAALAGGFVLAAALAAAQTLNVEASARREFLKKLVAAVEERTHRTVRYDPA